MDLYIGYETEELKWKADSLSAFLGVPVISGAPEEGEGLLRYGNDGLSLVVGDLSIRGDFSRLSRRIRNVAGEQLIRAARIKGHEGPLSIVDATAGLGEDSFILAAAGNRIRLFESDRVIYSLLSDALGRAMEDEALKVIAERMTVSNSDSVTYLRSPDERPDVVFLDPMFPERQKSSLVKKKLQLIQQFEMPCSNEGELFSAAAASHPKKIIIKRPVKGPFLDGRKPSYSISGKVIRYDCYSL